MRKGRSSNEKLTILTQECLVLLYRHDIYLMQQYVSTADNVLADAACRQYWNVLENNFDTYPFFADCRAKRLMKLKTANSTDRTKILPQRVQLAMTDFTEEAYETTTKANAKSAWKWWVEFMEECDADCYIHPDNKLFNIYLSGFKAGLADHLLGNVNSAGTVSTYASQVVWCLQQYHDEKLLPTVNRGIEKQLQGGKRYQGALDLTFYAVLYGKYAKCNDLLKIRNLLAYSFLGFTIQRSQSAAVNSKPKQHGTHNAHSD